MNHRIFVSAALVLALLAASPATAAPCWGGQGDSAIGFYGLMQEWMDVVSHHVSQLRPDRLGAASTTTVSDADLDGNGQLRPDRLGAASTYDPNDDYQLRPDRLGLRPDRLGAASTYDPDASTELRPDRLGLRPDRLGAN